MYNALKDQQSMHHSASQLAVQALNVMLEQHTCYRLSYNVQTSNEGSSFQLQQTYEAMSTLCCKSASIGLAYARDLLANVELLEASPPTSSTI
jgi:hypothetical protein